MRILYNIGIMLYGVIADVLALLGNTKAKKLRQGQRESMKMKSADFPENSFWFHVASLGEYQQIKPIIVYIKSKRPQQKILLSFFSPSGYENANDGLEDLRIYLPLDTRRNMRRFIGKVGAKHVFLSKYEIWPNMLHFCNQQSINVDLFSAYFRPDDFIMKTTGNFLAQALSSIQHIFVVDNDSLEALQKIYPLGQIDISGDMRTLSILQDAQKKVSITDVENFCKGSKCLIAGSIYIDEMNDLMQAWRERNEKIILVPHDVDEKSISAFESKLQDYSYQKWSHYNDNIDSSILLVDEVGMLRNLYAYADLAYIGGGFQKGIHNLLEPAVYGIPLIYGPRNNRFPEAEEFSRLGFGIEIHSLHDLSEATDRALEMDPEKVKTSSQSFFEDQQKYTDKVFSYLWNRVLMIS